MAVKIAEAMGTTPDEIFLKNNLPGKDSKRIIS